MRNGFVTPSAANTEYTHWEVGVGVGEQGKARESKAAASKGTRGKQMPIVGMPSVGVGVGDTA